MKKIYYSDILDKPNILESGKYKGFNYLIVSYGTHPCCYIEIPKEHSLYEKDYDDINIDCHGGLTFSKFRKFPSDKKEKYYIGWDYAHFGDMYYDEMAAPDEGKKWTIKEMFDEVKHVIDQIKGR